MGLSAERQERRTEGQVRIRQVTQLQASWTELERGAPGAFTLQLVLDHGVDAYILRPAAEDAGVLLRLYEQQGGAMFDLDRKVLLFTARPAG